MLFIASFTSSDTFDVSFNHNTHRKTEQPKFPRLEGLCGHVTITAAFSAVRFCSYTVRHT